METRLLMEIITIVVVGAIGWFIKVGYDHWTAKIDGKVDKSCHEECTKGKEAMFSLMLEEIRGLRQDFKDKSAIVVDAVTKK